MKKSKVIAALSSLAHETRLEVFRLLVQKGPQGLPAGQLGDRLGLPSPTLSFHLNHLKHAGLISSRRESRSIIYTAAFDRMRDLLAFLIDDCCGGDPSICAPLAEVMSEAACCAAKTKEPA